MSADHSRQSGEPIGGLRINDRTVKREVCFLEIRARYDDQLLPDRVVCGRTRFFRGRGDNRQRCACRIGGEDTAEIFLDDIGDEYRACHLMGPFRSSAGLHAHVQCD